MSEEPLTVLGAGPGAVQMAFYARAAGWGGAAPVLSTALMSEEERKAVLQEAVADGRLPEDKAAPVLCVCGGGPCAYSTTASLRRMGYNNVSNTTLHEFCGAVEEFHAGE